jgi:hypothetical protein
MRTEKRKVPVGRKNETAILDGKRKRRLDAY